VNDDYYISDGVVALAYVAVRMWLLAAHEARMEGRTIHYLHSIDRLRAVGRHAPIQGAHP
jgi:hypothetical protein